MSQNLSINQIQKIEFKTYDFLSNPNFEIVITHQEWDKTESTIKYDLFFDDFTILAEILNSLGSEIVTALVNNKICEANALARKAEKEIATK